ADRPAVLLPAVDPVGEPVVGGEVVELPRRLVVPAAPGSAPVDGNHRSLVACGGDVIRVLRVDPDEMVVVAAGRAFQDLEGLPSVGRAANRLAGHVHDVGTDGIGRDPP